MTTVSQVKPLLDYIGRYESNNNYDAIWGGVKKADHPPRPVSQMTIGQVLDWQDGIDARYMSEASGKYQFMEDTLRGIYRKAGYYRESPFYAYTQDGLALYLLRRRGLDDYMNDKITIEKFANSLAKEWASLPVVKATRRGNHLIEVGQSYYAGDGLNKAHAKPDDFLAVLREIKGDDSQSVPFPDMAEMSDMDMIQSRLKSIDDNLQLIAALARKAT